MFGRIAARYDLANRILSGGLDRGWRARMVRRVRACGARSVLDLATGSGDVAFALAAALPAGARIVGGDFCEPMLEQARAKQAGRGGTVSFVRADALDLPFPDGAFDAVTIAFGLRNLADRRRGLSEMRRVLRPGGRLWVLEFSQPAAAFRPLYYFYLRRILPGLGGRISGDRGAYAYLTDSIAAFPPREALSGEIRAAGFASVEAEPLALGAVALHEAVS